MTNLKKFLIITAALMLIGCGVWANVGKAPLSEMRGAWISQAMPGRV